MLLYLYLVLQMFKAILSDAVAKIDEKQYEVTRIHNITLDSSSSKYITIDKDKYPYKSTDDNEKINPITGDNINSYILLFVSSVLGILCTLICKIRKINYNK